MKKKGQTVDNFLEKYLRDKRTELIWALSMQQYTHSQIGRIFSINRSTALRIIRQKPRDWRVKWVKVSE